MADNPFDQLDDQQTSSNPFDALDTPHQVLYATGDNQLAPVKSPAAVASQQPTSGMSTYDKFMAGAGKAQYDAWRGIKQLFGVKGAQQEVDSSAQADKPLMQSGAGLAGDVAGSVADAVIPGGVGADVAGAAGLTRTAATLGGISNPATYGAAAASGALQGAIAPVPTGQSRAWNIGSGAALGGVGNAVARIPAMIMPPEQAATKAVQALTDAGVPLDAAQRTGSILLQRAKAMLSDNPLTAGAQADFADMQKKTFNKAVLSTMGENGTSATKDVMSGAKTRMGNVYDDIASRTNLPYDQLEVPLANIETESRKVLNDSQFGIVRRNLDDIMSKASQNGGNINGEQFSNIKKTLDGLSGGSDSDVANVARDLRQVMNDGLLQAAQASGNSADVKLLKQTNQQWGNMRKIEGAIDTEGSGDISPSKLANIFGQKANRYISVYGQGDTSLSDLAQAGKALLPSKTPNSGTPARALAQLAVSGAPAAALGTYEGFKSGDWKTGAKYAAGAYLLPKAIQAGLNSQGAAGSVLGGVGRVANAPVMLSTLLGGAAQHAPTSSLQALQDRMYRPAKPEDQSP